MNDNKLSKFLKFAEDERHNLYGIVVRKNGEVVYEHHNRHDLRVNMFSSSKTFTAVGVGIAIEEGYLSLDDKVVSFFANELPDKLDKKFHEITVRHLLMMSSGHEDGFLFSGQPETFTTYDYVKEFFSRPLKYNPGEKFVYNNACTYMLSAIIQQKTGIPLKQYLLPRLFEPLEISYPQWFECPRGKTNGATGLFIKTEELSRFCQMLLDNGVYKGKYIVSSEFIKDLSAVHIETGYEDSENKTYGYQIWHNGYPNSYRSDGAYGQLGMIFPDEKIVVAITSHDENRVSDVMRAVYSDVLPHFAE